MQSPKKTSLSSTIRADRSNDSRSDINRIGFAAIDDLDLRELQTLVASSHPSPSVVRSDLAHNYAIFPH
jgi:hypothetical protein